MRRIIFGDQITYFPDKDIDIYDGRDVKITIEKPESYLVGDQCRLIYGLSTGGVVGESILELYSPVIDVNGVATVVFYLPIFYQFLSYSNLITGSKVEITFAVKQKDITDYDFVNDVIVISTFYCHFSGSRDGNQLPPIPVHFYSEHSYGVFHNQKLNRQLRAVDDGSNIVRLIKVAGTTYFGTPTNASVTGMAAGQSAGYGTAELRLLSSVGFWQEQKLDNPLECVQLLWSEYGYETVRAFWFKIKEIEYDAEKWGEIREKKDLFYTENTSYHDTAELTHDAYFRKKKLILTSGVWERRIIDMLMPIVSSPLIYKYNPFPIYKTSVDEITRFHVFKKHDNDATLTYLSPGEYSFKKSVKSEDYILQRGQEYTLSIALAVAGVDQEITVKLFQGGNYEIAKTYFDLNTTYQAKVINFTLTANKDVAPLVLVLTPTNPTIDYKVRNVRITGNIGAYEVANIDRKALRVIMHDSKMAEIELTLNDDIQKPDYIVF